RWWAPLCVSAANGRAAGHGLALDWPSVRIRPGLGGQREPRRAADSPASPGGMLGQDGMAKATKMGISRRCRMSCVHRAHFLMCDIACGCQTVTNGPGTGTKGLLYTKTHTANQPILTPGANMGRCLWYVQNCVYRGECQCLSLPVMSRCGELASGV